MIRAERTTVPASELKKQMWYAEGVSRNYISQWYLVAKKKKCDEAIHTSENFNVLTLYYQGSSVDMNQIGVWSFGINSRPQPCVKGRLWDTCESLVRAEIGPKASLTRPSGQFSSLWGSRIVQESTRSAWVRNDGLGNMWPVLGNNYCIRSEDVNCLNHCSTRHFKPVLPQ